MFELSQIKGLDVEISARCNAYCLNCCRLLNQKDEYVNNILHDHLNQIYNIDLLKKHLKQFKKLEMITLCGNAGDPMSHPHIDQICTWIKHYFSNISIEIETNGSLGNKNTWKNLANLNLTINFSIDGLEDTNHIYRRNVSWKNLMENAKLYIEHGGNAVWQTIDFPHISHQIETMKNLSKKIGFKNFKIRNRFDPENDTLIVQSQNLQPQSMDKNQIEYYEFDTNPNWLLHNTIQPYCVQDKSLYIDGDASLWPCCTYAQIRYSDLKSYQRLYQHIVNTFGKSWNNLNFHTAEEILSNEFFKNFLNYSWTNREFLFEGCKKKCGRCLT